MLKFPIAFSIVVDGHRSINRQAVTPSDGVECTMRKLLEVPGQFCKPDTELEQRLSAHHEAKQMLAR